MKLKKVSSFFLFTIVMGFAFSACDSDKDDDFDSPITSEWNFSGYEYDVLVTDPSLKDSVTNFLKNTSWYSVSTYAFKENGTYTQSLFYMCGTGLEYPKDYFKNGTYKFTDEGVYFDGSEVASLLKKDGVLYSYRPYDEKFIAENLKIDVKKIVKATSVLVYNKAK